PGVYIMRNSSGKIIYIGKARQLKNRVSQYFGNQSKHTEKVQQMVYNVDDFEYIICDSEFEALILECSLIKQNSPKYNILLKDDKGYHYIKITRDEWPVIKAVMQKEDDNAEYIGPYNSAFVVRQTVDEVCKIYKIPVCSKKFPRDIKKGSRPCLNFFIDNCLGVCNGKISHEDYLEAVTQAVDFIKNGAKSAQSDLQAKMQKAAENLEFEKAARLRDRISAIKRINERQKVITSNIKNQDVIAMASGENSVCFEVFVFRNSKLCDREEFLLEDNDNSEILRAEFIKRYYSMRTDIPSRVVVDMDFEDKDLIAQWLSDKAKKSIALIIPQKGETLKLIQMCHANAAERLAQRYGKSGKQTAALDEIAKLLGLLKPPKYIESYDISNTAGSENVAGMITFLDGEPYRPGYKLFKIKSFSGQDDVRSMNEVLDRRFREYENNKENGNGFGRLPDLILLDGGIQQLSAAKAAMDKHNLNVPMFGMVKDSKHKTRAIASDGGDIAIKANRKAYTLIYTIQEEVHRFAIGFHHKRSNKSKLTSSLLEIDGVGPQKAKLLLQHFKTLTAIRNATAEQLETVAGISRANAKSIYEHFNA
ncbi:MAG: excinuclease ABC subunit UvrC, partial [Oscillospiraceae bacterium]